MTPPLTPILSPQALRIERTRPAGWGGLTACGEREALPHESKARLWQARPARRAPSRRRGSALGAPNERRTGIVPAVEHDVGVDEANQPARSRPSRSRRSARPSTDPRDHAGAIGGEPLGSRHVRRGGPGGARVGFRYASETPGDVGDAAFYGLAPGGVGRRARQQPFVVGERVGELAVLVLCQRQPEARLGALGVPASGSSRKRHWLLRRRRRRRRARRLPRNRPAGAPSRPRGERRWQGRRRPPAETPSLK